MRGYVLSADDDPKLLESHQKIMANYGLDFKPIEVLDTLEQTFNAEDFDCIHMDINFDPNSDAPNYQKSNGLLAVRDILRGRAHIPVMVISAYIDERAKQIARELGIWNAIYGWYRKSDDVDLIALDTIKAINDVKCYGKYDIKLNPNLLLNKLENLTLDIIRVLQSNDTSISKEITLLKELDVLKKITSNHLNDYFAPVSPNHLTLAKNFVKTLSSADQGRLMNIDAFEKMSNVLKILDKPKIIEDEISMAKEIMETTFHIQLDQEQDQLEASTDISESSHYGAILVDVGTKVSNTHLDTIRDVQKLYPQATFIPVVSYKNSPSVYQKTSRGDIKIIGCIEKIEDETELLRKTLHFLKEQDKLVKLKIFQKIETALLTNPSLISLQKTMREISLTHGFDLLKKVTKDLVKTPEKGSANTSQLTSILNILAYENVKSQLKKQHPSHYAAFLDGEFVGHNSNSEELIKTVYNNIGRTDIFIAHIGETQNIVHMRRPRRVVK